MVPKSDGVDHPQQQLVVEQRGHAPDQQAAVAGHDDLDADAGALLHDLLPGRDEAAAVEAVVRLEEALPAVEQHDDVRHPLGRRDVRPLLGRVGETADGQLLLPLRDLGAQPGGQPVHPVDLVAGHDRADVRHRHQRQQRVVAAVDAVDVHVGGADVAADRPGDGAQHGGATRAGRADDAQVATARDVVRRDVPALLGRQVDQAEGDGRAARPWAPLPGSRPRPRPGSAARSCAGSHGLGGATMPEALLASRAAVTNAARSVGTEMSSSACAVCARGVPRSANAIGPDVDDGARVLTARTATDAGGLERDEAGVPEPGVAAAGGGLGDLGRVGGLDARRRESPASVTRSAMRRLVLDLISALTTPRGALRRQDQVHAERPAPPGDVDQAGDEVGQLGHQRGELVDDDEQPRHRARRSGALAAR